MAEINFDYHPQFFTATILEWKHLLKPDEFKDIIIESLLYLKKEQSIVVYGFVIMPNHIHIIWQIQDGFKRDRIQMRFLKYTAQQMKFRLLQTDKLKLEQYRVSAKDREYQFFSPLLVLSPTSTCMHRPSRDLLAVPFVGDNHRYFCFSPLLVLSPTSTTAFKFSTILYTSQYQQKDNVVN